jgi:hypothetical protein
VIRRRRIRMRDFVVKLVALKRLVEFAYVEHLILGLYVEFPIIVKNATDCAFDKVATTRNSLPWGKITYKNYTREGKINKNVESEICLDAIKHYDEFLSAADKFNFVLEKEVDLSRVLHSLILYDETDFVHLKSMNRKFLLFYVFRVQELITMLPEYIVYYTRLFNQFLNNLGIFNDYKKLFESVIKLNDLRDTINLPLDLVKIIHNYSDLTIYSNVDKNIVSTKIAGNIQDGKKTSFNYFLLMILFVGVILLVIYF